MVTKFDIGDAFIFNVEKETPKGFICINAPENGEVIGEVNMIAIDKHTTNYILDLQTELVFENKDIKYKQSIIKYPEDYLETHRKLLK